MPDTGLRMRMVNGTPYEIRPCIDPDLHFTPQRWKEEIRRAWEHMSPLSRWERFASAVPDLSEEQLDYLTDVDGKDRVAWCAVIVENDQYRGIGVSRFIRFEDEVDTAMTRSSLTIAMKSIGQYPQQIEKRTAIRVVVRDRLASIAATRHVIDGARILATASTWRNRSIKPVSI